MGVSNDALVRCPLCGERYRLADALVNMPPLLEVVDADADDVAWDDDSHDAHAALASEPSPVDDITEPDSGSLSGLEFEAPEAPDELLGEQDRDTEVEDLAPLAAIPGDDEPDALADLGEPVEALSGDADDADDLGLDFGEPVGEDVAEAETLAFTDSPADEDAEPAEISFDDDPLSESASEAATVEFGDTSAADDDVQFSFDDDSASGGAAETIEFGAEDEDAEQNLAFDFDNAGEPNAEGGLREFEDLHVDASGEAEDIPFEEPAMAVVTPVGEAEEPEADGKKKKGKKKKEKKPKAPRAAGKRSLVGTLVSVGLPSLLAVVFVLYGITWLSPDYDFLGMTKVLPGFMTPDYASSQQYIAGRPTTMPSPDPTPSLEQTPAPELGTDPTQPEMPDPGVDASTPEPTDDASGGVADAEPAAEPVAETPSEAPPAPSTDDPFADTPPAAEAPAEEMAADAAPADDPFGSPAADDVAAPADAAPAATDDPFGTPAEEMPAEEAGDPFGTPAPEETPATDDPFGTPAPAPADDDPFGTPTPAPDATPAADDPFGTPAPADAPEEMPADDDPFGTPTPDTPPAADDPFGTPTPDAAPADDPFGTPAGAPEEMPSDDPFAADAPSAETLPEPSEALGPRDVAAVTPADLMGAAQATMTARQQLDAAEQAGDAAAVRKAKTNFYVSLFGMADTVTKAQLGESAAAMKPFLAQLEPAIKQELAADAKQLDALRVFGGRWFAFPKRPNNGAALVGTVQAAEQVGKLFQTKLQLGDGPDAPVVTVVSAQDPQLAPGDNVLSLGSIIEQPAEQVAGYEGSDPAVVWSGLTMKLPPSGE